MSQRMRVQVRAQGHEHACVALKYFKASITIFVGDVDIDIRLLVNLRSFIKEYCKAGLCSIERGDVLTHKHFQMVIKGNLSSLPILIKKIKVAFGWDAHLPTTYCFLQEVER